MRLQGYKLEIRMIVYAGDYRNFTREFLNLLNNFCKVAGYKIKSTKLFALLFRVLLLSMDFHDLSQSQASLVLHDTYMPSKPGPPELFLHIAKYSCSMWYKLSYL